MIVSVRDEERLEEERVTALTFYFLSLQWQRDRDQVRSESDSSL
jgi:hypothetical protein